MLSLDYILLFSKPQCVHIIILECKLVKQDKTCDFLLTSHFSLARLYSDAQGLLFSDPEFLQLGRLWRELNVMSNFMDTLRNHPEQVLGQCSRLSSSYCKGKLKVNQVILVS